MRSMVLDKSTLQACRADELEQFSKKYRPVLPCILVYEILTEDPSKPGAPHWSSYFRKLRNCRFVVTQHLGDILAQEACTCRPARSIDDHRLTRVVKQRLAVPFEPRLNPRDLLADEQYAFGARKLVDKRRGRLGIIVSHDFVQAASAVSKIAGSTGHSLAWAWHQATKPAVFRAWKEDHPRLPLLATVSSFRFMEVWLNDYYDFRRGSQGPGSCRDVSAEVLINEALDIHYLLNLIVKDGIVSGDGLMCETAKAFFPGRLVFADLKQAMD